jgi:hypothetical protein
MNPNPKPKAVPSKPVVNHSPLPWRVEHDVLWASDGNPVIERVPYEGLYMRNEDEDKALICRAVNSHAALVQACKTIIDAHSQMFAQCLSNPVKNAWGKEISVSALNKASEEARAALRLAGEEI